MEIFRAPNASTFVTFPMITTNGVSMSGLSVTGSWLAWSDTSGPNAAGNPGFRTLTGAFGEIAASATYAVALAAAELPTASPYVMLRFNGTGAATQYVLIRTASLYANVSGIAGTAVATPVTAGYMPIDVKQTISLSSPADNSVEKSLARTYFATDYVNATISSRLPTASISLSGGAVTVGTNSDKTGYSVAVGGVGAGAIAAAELNNIADSVLDRNMATGADSGSDSAVTRTARQALRVLRNKATIVAGVLTVAKEDDSTTSWTAAVTTTAGNPISTVDPTG